MRTPTIVNNVYFSACTYMYLLTKQNKFFRFLWNWREVFIVFIEFIELFI